MAARFRLDAPPLFRWFEGSRTNACFNEVDRHVLAGKGAELAFVWEGDRWDPLRFGGHGGSVHELRITRKQLLLEVVKAAEVLRALGLQAGDGIAFNLRCVKRLSLHLYQQACGGAATAMLRRASLRANEALLVFYGAERELLLDQPGHTLIEAVLAAGVNGDRHLHRCSAGVCAVLGLWRANSGRGVAPTHSAPRRQ